MDIVRLSYGCTNVCKEKGLGGQKHEQGCVVLAIGSKEGDEEEK